MGSFEGVNIVFGFPGSPSDVHREYKRIAKNALTSSTVFAIICTKLTPMVFQNLKIPRVHENSWKKPQLPKRNPHAKEQHLRKPHAKEQHLRKPHAKKKRPRKKKHKKKHHQAGLLKESLIQNGRSNLRITNFKQNIGACIKKMTNSNLWNSRSGPPC